MKIRGLFATNGIVVGTASDPALISALCVERKRAYSTGGPGEFGHDLYDDYADHLIAFLNATGKLLGSMRLGPGPRLLRHKGFSAFELSRYFEASLAPGEFLRSALEISRVWITPEDIPQRRFVMPALWTGLQEYLHLHPNLTHIVGAVALADYPPEAAERVVAHFARFHASPQTFFSPIKPAPMGSSQHCANADAMNELTALNDELRLRNPRKAVPPLLRLYAQVGMTVLADPGYDETGRGILIPVHLFTRNLAPSFETMRTSLQGAT